MSQSQDQEGVARFKAWFSKLRRYKSYSFKVYKPDKFYICEEGNPAEEETESMRINFREVERLMKEDLKEFVFLMLRLSR